MFESIMTVTLNGWTITEVPESYAKYPFMVIIPDGDEMRYYGGFRKEQSAIECAHEVGGVVVPTAE